MEIEHLEVMAPIPDWLHGKLTEPQYRQGATTQESEAIPEGRRNQTLTSLAGTMRRRGMKQDEIEAALLVVNAKRCKPPLPQAEVRAIAASVSRYPSQPADLEQQLKTAGKSVITWVPSELEPIIKELQSRVLSHPESNSEPVLSHGRRLVTVHKDVPKTVRQVKKSLEEGYPPMFLIRAFEIELLRMRVMRDVVFLNDKGRQIAMPDRAVRAFEQASVDHASPLVAIVEHPLIDPDGRLITGTGYDPTTGLYRTIPPTIVPCLDGAMDGLDAELSLHWLQTEYLAEYPFATLCDRDAAIALNLALLERVFIAGTSGYPAYSSTAPTQGSGKTTLFNQASHAVLGRTAAATSWPKDSEEMAKIIVALLLEGHSFVLFDNLPDGRPFSSDEVAKLLTSEMYSNRVLSVNKMLTAAANVFVGFTGNNITPADDFATRVLQIELKPDTEDPDRRKFDRPDIIEWTAVHRAEILFHLCVLVACYLRSGVKVPATPTRFSMWDQLVRYPILWAGGHDVADLFERNRFEDPNRMEHALFLSAWLTFLGPDWQQVSEVLTALNNEDCKDPQRTELLLSVQRLLGKSPLTSHSLAGLLKRLQNKIIDGMRLEHAPLNEDSRSNRRPRPWCVKKAGS